MRSPYALRSALVLAAAAAAGCGSDPTRPTFTGGPIAIVSGSGSTDTISAPLTAPIVVRITDADGHAVTGVEVRFEGVPVPTGAPGGGSVRNVKARSVGQPDHGGFAADTTDAEGLASAAVTLGGIAGPAGMAISVPTLGLADTARYTVTAGAAARLTMTTHDTAALTNASLVLAAHLTDRLGNARPEQATFSASSPLLAVDGAGTVTTGATVGRAVVRASVGAVRDSASVMIAPRGAFAVLYAVRNAPAVVAVTSLDGSGLVSLAQAPSPAYPALSPDGNEVAYQDVANGGRLVAVSVATGVVRPVADPAEIASGSNPRYSRDGQYIYFSGRTTSNFVVSLWRVRRDGSGLQQLWSGDSIVAIDANPAGTIYADPSVDGGTVAFGRAPGNLHFLDVATGQVRDAGYAGLFPRYSPDGQYLAVNSQGRVTVRLLDGTVVRTFAASSSADGGLTWCADSTCLIGRGDAGLQVHLLATGETLPIATMANDYQPGR